LINEASIVFFALSEIIYPGFIKPVFLSLKPVITRMVLCFLQDARVTGTGGKYIFYMLSPKRQSVKWKVITVNNISFCPVFTEGDMSGFFGL
jgi:hypothetical protein